MYAENASASGSLQSHSCSGCSSQHSIDLKGKFLDGPRDLDATTLDDLHADGTAVPLDVRIDAGYGVALNSD